MIIVQLAMFAACPTGSPGPGRLEEIIMFGQSFLVSKAVKFIAEAFDCDEDTAKVLGMVAGCVVAVATLDLAGGTWSVDTLGSQEAVDHMRDRFLDD